MALSANEYKIKLKKKFKEGGLRSLESDEILKLVLFYSMPSHLVFECADSLIDHFGSIGAVFNAPYTSLLEVDKMTEKAAAFIKLIPSVCAQYTKSCAENSVLVGCQGIRDFFATQFYSLDHEVVKLACLDKKLHVVNICTIAGGETSSVMINARLLVSEVINSGCVGCILAHNHPQGNCRPSQEDISLTQGIRALLQTIDVKLFDHIIVGNDGVWSLKADGKI